MSEMATAIDEAKRRWPEATHLRVGENLTLCEKAGEREAWQIWGEYLTDVAAEVGCPACKEWMHA